MTENTLIVSNEYFLAILLNFKQLAILAMKHFQEGE